jgi:hypothetical protein
MQNVDVIFLSALSFCGMALVGFIASVGQYHARSNIFSGLPLNFRQIKVIKLTSKENLPVSEMFKKHNLEK